jgi:hypothetical protein
MRIMRSIEPCSALRIVALLALATALLAESSVARGQEPQVGTLKTMDPRPIGLGGALRASPSSTSGIYLNPATIAMARVYHINLMYQYTGEDDLHTAGAAAVDSVTSSIIAAGISLNYLRSDQTRTDHESWDARLALAGNIGDIFFLGMTGRYIRVEHDLESGNRGPNGTPALPSSGNQQVDGFTFDAGAAVAIGGIVSLGVTGYNLTNTGSVYAPVQLGSGAALTLFDMLLIELDVVVDFTSHTDVNEEIHGGAELFLANMIPLRVGYIYDVHFNIHTIAAGLGYVDPSFAVDFGFQREARQDGRWILAFGLRIFIG